MNFSKSDIEVAIQKLSSKNTQTLSEAFEKDGMLGMKFESCTFIDFSLSARTITATYAITFLDDDNSLYKSNCFLSWDGKHYSTDISGTVEFMPSNNNL